MKLQKLKLTLPAALAALLISGQAAHALTTLKQVQVGRDSQVDLLFDAKLSKAQIKTEFFNDIIQISLTDAAVYPAKISSVSGNHLSKIFAYQYAPKLVRCRLTVKGQAEEYKDRIQVIPQGKVLSIKLAAGTTDEVTLQSAAAERAASGDPKGVKVEKEQEAVDAEEKALLERVLKASQEEPKKEEPKKEAQREKSKEVSAKDSSDSDNEKPAKKEKGSKNSEGKVNLTGGKNPPSPLKAFGKMALVLGIFLLIALAVKKILAKGMASQNKGVLGAVSRFAQKSLGTSGKMIQVVSTHNLGPKKSIVVVKVAGRLLVLGIANDSINLITQLNEQSEAEDIGLEDIADLAGPVFGNAKQPAAGASAAGNPIFADLLASESGKPNLKAPIRTQAQMMQQQQQQQQQQHAHHPAAAQSRMQQQTQRAHQVPGAMHAYNAASRNESLPNAPHLQGPAVQVSPEMSIRAKIRSKMEGLKPL